MSQMQIKLNRLHVLEHLVPGKPSSLRSQAAHKQQETSRRRNRPSQCYAWGSPLQSPATEEDTATYDHMIVACVLASSLLFSATSQVSCQVRLQHLC